jgi:hypothetical protein
MGKNMHKNMGKSMHHNLGNTLHQNIHKQHSRKKKWNELSPMARVGTITAGIVQLSLLVAAQTDITRRPAAQIRGSKAMWRLATLVNFIGPATYFTFGVKHRPVAK